MATIKNGYDSKPTHIKLNARDDRKLELWIDQEGLEKFSDNGETIRFMDYGVETLGYVTIEEAIALRDELNEAIKKMAGI